MTLLEIEAAASALPADEKRQLVQFILHRLDNEQGTAMQPRHGHSVLDIPTVSLGELLTPFSSEDDFLGEMLEDRKRFTGSILVSL